MAEAGMHTWVDNLGNVHGRVEGKEEDAPTLFIGSHYDTVVDGGKYDGALGVVAGISAVKTLLLDVSTLHCVCCQQLMGGSCSVNQLEGRQRIHRTFYLLSTLVPAPFLCTGCGESGNCDLRHPQ